MNEELLEQLLPIAEKTKEGILAAIDALREQAPELVNEVLWWNGVFSAIWFCIGIGITLVLFKLFTLRMMKWAKEDYKKDEDGTVYGVVGCLHGLFALPLIFAFVESLDWLQILIAPRLYLLEYVSELLKG